MRKRLLSLLFAGIFTASSLAQGFPVLAEDQLMTESPAVGMTEQAAQNSDASKTASKFL